MEPNPVPTLVLYGPEDHVIPATFPRAAEVAFPNRMGPFTVPGAGHFLAGIALLVVGYIVTFVLKSESGGSDGMSTHAPVLSNFQPW